MQIIKCGHFVHQECIEDHFRCFDGEAGYCPECEVPLCHRPLKERIELDRVLIFGRKRLTDLPDRRAIDFELPQQDEIIVCSFEEQIAAVQLRTIKDLVDVCMHEAWTRFQTQAVEPYWYGIVSEVLEKFRAQGLPMRIGMQFPNEDALLELLIWAELVRSMNSELVAIKKSRGSKAFFLNLKALHEIFQLAKKRFDAVVETSPKDPDGRVPCQRVADDAYTIAMKTFAAAEKVGTW
ncbi:hypothetical protein CC80DRAFT_427894 [Byssothecium circinans]|uniref:Uncharacterized protein n=1 Tax=Byssothecium circinans TaxID=147558 RepID=A0A6A5TCQ2_9PLEO|nr:hypothetical protein CC80DRAFT_427894 [Byssothecium circinans]